MTNKLTLTRDDPIVHLKAYGGVKIQGVEGTEITCDIEAPELATMVEEDGQVYITANTSCRITMPIAASIQIEKGMGTVEIQNIQNEISIEKALGNLILSDISQASVGKVGGNFSVRDASGDIRIEKVGGNIVAADTAAFKCEKIGGSCIAKNIKGDFFLEKAGGSMKAQWVEGTMRVEKLGGSFTAKDIFLEGDLHVGGDIHLINPKFGAHRAELYAGGDVQLEVSDEFTDAAFELRSGDEDIRIKLAQDELIIDSGHYEYQVGNAASKIEVAAGGLISISSPFDPDEEVVGDISNRFQYEESPFSEMIRERVESATRIAEAKVKTAEIRLGQIRDRVEKHRGFNVNVDFDKPEPVVDFEQPEQPVPPVSRPPGKKGATNEERLMILKMLQDKKITVDEAETLFNALAE